VRKDSFMRVTRPIHMRDKTHSDVWHNPSFIRVPWPVYMCHDVFIVTWCVLWLVQACDMIYSHSFIHGSFTHTYVWHDSCICVTWLIHIWLIQTETWRIDSFIRVPWLIHTCDMTQS